jgi:hypothetical protein
MSSKRVEGENPLSPDLKGFGVWCSETFWVEDVQCLLLCPTGWAPHGTAPSELGNHSHRSAPGKLSGLVWCDSLLSIVFLDRCPLSSQECWGHPWYGVYGSLAVLLSEEPVVSRLLGRNR